MAFFIGSEVKFWNVALALSMSAGLNTPTPGNDWAGAEDEEGADEEAEDGWCGLLSKLSLGRLP